MICIFMTNSSVAKCSKLKYEHELQKTVQLVCSGLAQLVASLIKSTKLINTRPG